VIDIALALILHPNRPAILIARRRKGAHLAEFWEFPGGKVEAGELVRACAVREAQEETGLVVTPLEDWEPVVYTYPDRTVLLHPVVCRASTGEAKALESDEIVWVSSDELAQYQFPPANDSILVKLAVYLARLAR